MKLQANWDDMCSNMIRHGYCMLTEYDFWNLQQEMKNVKTAIASINLSTCVSEDSKLVIKVDVPKVTNYSIPKDGAERYEG